jgi:hypothetical protein
MTIEITDEELERRMPGLIKLIADIKNRVPTVLVVPPGMELAARAFIGGTGNKTEILATCGVCGTQGKAGVKGMRIHGANRVCLICLKIVTEAGKVPLDVRNTDDFEAFNREQRKTSVGLTQVEIDRRIPGLARIFSPTRDPVGGVVLLHRTADREVLKEISGWVPSILHSLTTCEVCGDECWIGPEQAKQTGADKVCSVCLTLAHEIAGTPMPEPTVLNPNEAQIPRRA